MIFAMCMGYLWSMARSRRPDELDLELVDVLQLNARAPWQDLAGALDVAPMTLARRWDRLTAEGLAWSSISVAAGASQGAVIELDCAHGSVPEIAQLLAQKPNVITVAHTSGDFGIYALMLTADLSRLAAALDRTIPEDRRILRTRVHVFGSILGGVTWREGIMSRHQTEQVRPKPDAEASRESLLSVQDRPLFLELAADARIPYVALADTLGTSAYAVKRRVGRLVRAGEIDFRCDIARPLFGYPMAAFLKLTVPDSNIRRFGALAGAWKETRFCAEVTSAANMILIVSVRSLEHLHSVLQRIYAADNAIEVTDRRYVLNQVKVYGRLLHPDGRPAGHVPVDPWFDLER
jgi:DNA-binding Lrp family transcriptional regulator